MKRIICIMLVIMTGVYLGTGPSMMSAATAAPRTGLFDFFRKKKKTAATETKSDYEKLATQIGRASCRERV